MPDAATVVPVPANEPVRGYAPGSGERTSLETKLKELGSADPVELTMTIAGAQRMGSGEPIDVVQPHRHSAVLGTLVATTSRRPSTLRWQRPPPGARRRTTTARVCCCGLPSCWPGRGATP